MSNTAVPGSLKNENCKIYSTSEDKGVGVWTNLINGLEIGRGSHFRHETKQRALNESTPFDNPESKKVPLNSSFVSETSLKNLKTDLHELIVLLHFIS